LPARTICLRIERVQALHQCARALGVLRVGGATEFVLRLLALAF